MAQRSKSDSPHPEWSASQSAATDASARAAAAADAVIDRHLRRFAGLPGTLIGTVAWPASSTTHWHYWWQAHFVDLLVDAEVARPGSVGTARVGQLLRGIHLHNLARWTNDYYDDMAWLGLAIERARRHLGVGSARGLRVLAGRIHGSWAPAKGGGIPWRTMDYFFNAPSNGPGAILMARTGETERAAAMCDWVHKTLVGDNGLILDGIKPPPLDDPKGDWQLVRDIYTYCQGVVLGAELEVLRAGGGDRHRERIGALLTAVEKHLLVDATVTVDDEERAVRIIPGAGGGDGGLFAGILARYLALVATDLPDGAGAADVRARAARIVLDSAEAVWETRAVVDERPVFSADPRRPAVIPTADGAESQFIEGAVRSSETPERDLSVQLSAWKTLEAAARVAGGIAEH
ncbi:MAG: glycoside hydrolase family 76 protein [Gordonia sp. (in: high G+C Gram-positive bacteria)]|uniref:glycoside hydrolase family 76 protein n=1 Tax=Gordonia sp. (in: high G+C Gram-positive bacteria) TaxID=84139 RepID=UPI0039E4BE8B